MKKIFNSIKEYAIKEDDIFSAEISPNFELFELFVKNNYINNENYFDTEYFESISQINEKVYINLKDLKIPFLKISDLIENHKQIFLSKLKLIFINEGNKPSELYNKICENINKCKIKLIEIKNIEDYLGAFEPIKEANLKNSIAKILNLLKERNICDIIKRRRNIQN